MNLAVLAVLSIAVFRTDCRERPNGSDLRDIYKKEISYLNGNSIEERKGCSPTISCTRAGGQCVKKRAKCSGTVDSKGCMGGKKCMCCIPDHTTQPPLTCPTTQSICTCPTCPTTTTDITTTPGVTTTDINTTPGYSKGPEGMLWHPDICKVLSNIKQSLQSCMGRCSENNDCNAFNFVSAGVDTRCESLKCPIPIPEPTWNYGKGWVGYSEGCGAGTFIFGSSRQCFRVLKDKLRTFDEAQDACKLLGLGLAHPQDPIGLRKYIVEKYGSTNHAWIGARSDGRSIKWLRTGQIISKVSSLWWNGDADAGGLYNNAGACVGLNTHASWLSSQLNAVYSLLWCTHQKLTICELVNG